MSDIAVRVEHLGKRYHIGARQRMYRTFRETITDAALRPLRRLRGEGSDSQNTIWALDDISFEVKRGEAVGIIGRNGAGKSTLLKILSRITWPTRGRVELFGRVGSLIEVGTGFHHELTGRENIFLNGAILGMKRREIERKFDEIVAFSEIEKFLDTPVKFYSSGMYVRLAFAVAAYLEPEILVVDEVLAVGDADFQKKCLGKMGEVELEGRTVLFVSHNMSAISQLCKTALLLKDGRIVKDGLVQDVIVDYIASGGMESSGDLDVQNPSWRINPSSSADRRFKWTRITLLNSKGQIAPGVMFGEPFEIVLHGVASESVTGFQAGLGIHTAMGVVVFNSWDTEHGLPTGFPVGDLQFRVKVQPNFLSPGTYEAYVGASGSHVDDSVGPFRFDIQAAPFNAKYVWNSNHRGIVANPCTWSVDGA